MFSGVRAFSHSDPIFFFVDVCGGLGILSLYMARIYSLHRKSTLSLRQRKNLLLSQLKIDRDLLRASFVERFSVCGKKNCHCHHGGDKHGPFYYLTQCLAVGNVAKFLLKTQAQQQQLLMQRVMQGRRAGGPFGPVGGVLAMAAARAIPGELVSRRLH